MNNNIKEKHFCKCGCGKQLVWKKYYSYYGWPKFIYNHARTIANQRKGKTFEEIFGKKRAEEIKRKIGKGKTWEEAFGKERVKYIRKNHTRWNKNNILNATKKVLSTKGLMTKKQFSILHKEKIMCSRPTIEKHYESLESLMKEAGGYFISPFMSNVTERERQVLNKIELEKNIKLIRQFSVGGKFIDGYDPISNVAYEVDEQYHHKYKQIQDNIREQKIKEEINCEFVRIKV